MAFDLDASDYEPRARGQIRQALRDPRVTVGSDMLGADSSGQRRVPQAAHQLRERGADLGPDTRPAKTANDIDRYGQSTRRVAARAE